jgi:glycosyltransferase involved in cell wall biosynthesis
MRIAQIAPLFEAVPPKLYGGTERVVSALTEELVAMGHDVTLFASGDSVTTAKLDPMRPEALRLDPTIKDWVSCVNRQVELVRRRAHEFDVMHFHIDYFPNSVMTRQSTPFLTTIHGRLDLPEFADIYGLFPEVPMVSISDSQRAPLPNLNWVRTVLHGMPENRLRPVAGVEQSYFAFLGRISPEKGIESAIRIATAAGVTLKVAAKVDVADRRYFEQAVQPLLAENGANVEFIGEINDAQKPAFLSGAKALLFPIDWPEPFGLVMIEAMACGCPVIARRRGSVPEVMEDGLTGFVIENEAEAVAAIGQLHTLDRGRVRQRFEQRWTARRMAEDYVDVYEELVEARLPRLRAVGD